MAAEKQLVCTKHTSIPLEDAIYAALALSPDGKFVWISGADDRMVRCWDLETQALAYEWIATVIDDRPAHQGLVTDVHRIASLALDYEHSILITGGWEIHAWNIITKKKIKSFKGGGWGDEMFISPDGSELFTLNRVNGKITCWDITSGKKKYQVKGESPSPMILTPDGNSLIVLEHEMSKVQRKRVRDLKLNLRSTRDGIITRHFESDKITHGFNGLTISSNGELVAGGGVNGFHIWNFSGGKHLHHVNKKSHPNLAKHLDITYMIQFIPTTDLLMEAGSDGAIVIWDAISGQPVASMKGEKNFTRLSALNLDGSSLVTVCMGDNGAQSIEVWKLAFQV
jgi:WD40 repeat protein